MTPVAAHRTAELTTRRLADPESLRRAVTGRTPFPGSYADQQLLIIAADHPARGALAAGGDPHAMADRADLLDRIETALGRPGVHGFLGTADTIEDLALRGALAGKVVFGSMNRAGLAGAIFELDDRFTGYDAAGVAEHRLDGGKMLLRIDRSNPHSLETLAACARAVDDLAAAKRIAMVEPFMSHRVDGHLRNDLTPDAMITAISIASGLGRTSAYTWLKLPVVPEMERVMAATTLPSLILGGEVQRDQDAALAGWQQALTLPAVRGLVIGRSLLYPPGDDVAATVDAAVSLL